MICGTDELAQVFSVLHDGVVLDASLVGEDLVLRVDITYLAQRVAAEFTTFLVRICDVHDLAFVTWPKDASAAPATVHDLAAIFAPPLDILSGSAHGDRVEVVCNQPSAETPHCGGILSFRARSADVTDQNGDHYSLAKLGAIADAYWKDWSERAPR